MATMHRGTRMRRLKVRIAEWRKVGPPKSWMENANMDWHYYPDAMRFHVTLNPVFRASESLTASTSASYVLNYAVTKLAAMEKNGDYRIGDTMYVWDLGAPSGTRMPFAKFQLVDGEVRRG